MQPPMGSGDPKETVASTVSLTNATISSYGTYAPAGGGVQPPTGGGPKEPIAATVNLTNAQIVHYLGPNPPHSLIDVRVINSLVPLPPGSQPLPHKHQTAVPVPTWLKYVLAGLRPYMKPTGTIHLGGFHFDARDLSTLAGVPVRTLP
jgi:hypothetical protein